MTAAYRGALWGWNLREPHFLRGCVFACAVEHVQFSSNGLASYSAPTPTCWGPPAGLADEVISCSLGKHDPTQMLTGPAVESMPSPKKKLDVFDLFG